ncbi:MAG TPA: low temperature requirement protein A [Gaiellales bacterium]
MEEAATERAERVTTLELFFDLVFVFTITQLTTVLSDSPTAAGLLRVVLMLTVIWWMYGGYAWLTNAVRADTPARRFALLGGMGAYLALALTIPRAFSGNGLEFALAYLVVVMVHSTLFTRAAGMSARALLRLSSSNLTAAAIVLAGGAAGGTAQYVLWAGAGLFEWLLPTLRRTEGGFAVGPAHFVERHGLVIIVAIGESVVAVGFDASHLPLDADLFAGALAGLALSACLWWTYFGTDAERAERALGRLQGARRSRAALLAFGYWHLLMLLGIVAVASAERHATGHAFAALSWARAAILAGGVAVYCAGDTLFRRELALGRLGVRGAAAVLALAAIPIGAWLSPFAELMVLVALLSAVFAIEASRPAQPAAA